MVAYRMTHLLPSIIAAIYLLIIFTCWFRTLQSGAALTIEGLVMVLLLMPWLAIFHFLIESSGLRGFDHPLWQPVAMAISTALNAGLLYLIMYSTVRSTLAICRIQPVKLDSRGPGK